MEVVAPVQEFHLNSKTATSYMSSSSSPKRLEFQYHCSTAPNSPSAAAAATAASPTPITEDEDDDFAFDFSGHLDKNGPPPELTTADELFYKGKIRPLKFPLHLCSLDIVGKHSDPFSATLAEPSRDIRGRNRAPSLSSRSRKGSRSLSPLRKAEEEENNNNNSSSSSNSNSKKWCFKDLLLFRSASEGRATGDRNKDPLRKYTAACLSPKGKKGSGGDDQSRSLSFRCVSPHAMHYAANRAAAEEMKRKTALPYKESLLSWWRFAPALRSFGGLVGGDHHHSANRGKSFVGSKSMPRLR